MERWILAGDIIDTHVERHSLDAWHAIRRGLSEAYFPDFYCSIAQSEQIITWIEGFNSSGAIAR